MLGHGHLEITCFDGVKRIGHIRGKLRKKVWMNVGDIILLSLRDFQEGRGDIILKYSSDEARSLKSLGEIPEAGIIFIFFGFIIPSHYQRDGCQS